MEHMTIRDVLGRYREESTHLGYVKTKDYMETYYLEVRKMQESSKMQEKYGDLPYPYIRANIFGGSDRFVEFAPPLLLTKADVLAEIMTCSHQ